MFHKNLIIILLYLITNGSSQYHDLDELGETTIVPENALLPASFDARLKWGTNCKSIGYVRNQGRCRSGWAISISDVISDRMCITTVGAYNYSLSAMMLLSCCQKCCGCKGGHILNAWKFTQDTGLVTGSVRSTKPFRDIDGCQPYSLKPLSQKHIHESSTQCMSTPRCTKNACTNSNNQTSIGMIPKTLKIAGFKLFARNKSEIIMREILNNGPLQVSFYLYEDFRYYKGDKKCPIYVHTWGKRDGEHAAKLIGWGTEHKMKYWLLINSFGPKWGCNGTFRVARTEPNNFDFGFAIIGPTVSTNSGSFSVFKTNVWTLFICFILAKSIQFQITHQLF